MKRLLLTLLLGSLAPLSASANIGDAYGFGAQWGSLGGAGLAGGSNPFSAYYNPASLAAPSAGTNLQVGYGLMYAQPVMKAVGTVVTENRVNSSNASAVSANVDSNYRENFGQTVAAAYTFLPNFHRMTLGLVTYIPMTSVAYMDTGEPMLPEYILYRSRNTRPQVDFAVGAALGAGWHLGLGGHIGYTMASTADVFLTSAANTNPTMRFSAALTPKVAPFAGIYFEPEQSSFGFGAVFRAAVSSDANMILRTKANVLGFLPAIPFNFQAASALYYDPMTAELGARFNYASWGKVLVQAEYQFWSSFQAPALSISNLATSAGVTLTPSVNLGQSFNNILVLRAGNEFALDESRVVRMGYSFKPTILRGDGSGAGNFIDPTKHSINLGFGFKFKALFGRDIPWNVDIQAAYQLLVGGRVTKASGNELGDASDSKIGAPGYDTGGSVFMGGATISLLL